MDIYCYTIVGISQLKIYWLPHNPIYGTEILGKISGVPGTSISGVAQHHDEEKEDIDC